MRFEPVKAGRVFEAILRGQGLDPATASLAAAEKARVADLANEALAAAWRYALWPGLMDLRQILYRDLWASGTLYAAASEVAHRDADGTPRYYRALVANSGVEPGTDPATWEEPADFLPGFYFCTYHIDEMDLANGLFAVNPDLRPDPKPYALKPTHYGACVADLSASYPAEPWIRFRPMPPEYSWTDWVVDADYAAGDIAYHASSSWQCPVANTGTEPGTDASVWTEVPFPKMFLPYVVAWCVAQRMHDDDGRAAQFARAERLLAELEERHLGQMRVRRRARVRVC